MSSDSQRDLHRAMAQADHHRHDEQDQREITQLAVKRAAAAAHEDISVDWQRVVSMLQRRAAERSAAVAPAWNEESEAAQAGEGGIHDLFVGAVGVVSGLAAGQRQTSSSAAGGPAGELLPLTEEDDSDGWSR